MHVFTRERTVVYLLFAIAGLWMADGLALLLYADRLLAVMQALAVNPGLLKWGGLAAILGVILLVGGQSLAYQPLWVVVALAMIAKGAFWLGAPDPLRHAVIMWCLKRDVVDYRFLGLGLCTLSLLLLDALGWVKGE